MAPLFVLEPIGGTTGEALRGSGLLVLRAPKEIGEELVGHKRLVVTRGHGDHEVDELGVHSELELAVLAHLLVDVLLDLFADGGLERVVAQVGQVLYRAKEKTQSVTRYSEKVSE